MLAALLCLQILHVAFLLLHDWIRLGTLNDTRAVRAANPGGKLLRATLVSSAPFVIALFFSLRHQRTGYPHWLFLFLWIAYALLFFGELQAWWFPFFFGTEPARVARYDQMFGATHSFLPPRNGIRINTLHTLLHLATLLTLLALADLTL